MTDLLIPSLKAVGIIPVPEAVLKHRFIREAMAVAALFSEDDDRRERVIGTLNSKKCELYGWGACVAPHVDNLGFVYLLPLTEGFSAVFTDDSEIQLTAGTVVRLHDFKRHWTVDTGLMVCAFVGAFKAPADAEALAILQAGITALAKGDYYDAPRVRPGFRAMLDDECLAVIDFDSGAEPMLISDALVCGLYIETCGNCGAPATELDGHYPYMTDHNRCNQCSTLREHKASALLACQDARSAA